jgi:lipid-binding SYLF domain-containing protein
VRLSSAICSVFIALTATGAGLATAAYADSGIMRFNVIKAGIIVGGSAGNGTLVFHGRRYPLAIGGLSYGFTFGASATDFVGTVSNIRRISDVNGVYGAVGAGVAVGPAGAGVIVLTNQNGAVLTLSGRQAGLIVAADLNGLVISVQ